MHVFIRPFKRFHWHGTSAQILYNLFKGNILLTFANIMHLMNGVKCCKNNNGEYVIPIFQYDTETRL